jgi:hypothetical protein
MSFFDLLRKRRPLDEKARRELLLRKGRITEGHIIDHGFTDDGELVHLFYTYSVSGADYESSQIIFDDQRSHIDDYEPGMRVTVRYDPNIPTNSIVV